jgi:hypothetical protein
MSAATATVVDAVSCASDAADAADCTCGIDVSGLRLPGLSDLPACPEGCVDGAVLTPFLAALVPADLATDREVLDLVAAWARVTSWSQARGLRGVVEFARRPEAAPGSDPLVARAGRRRLGSVARWHTDAELGAALSISPTSAERRLATACQAAERFPATLDALETGRIDWVRLDAMVVQAGWCSPEVAARVEQAVLAGGDHGSGSEFRREVRRQALRIDPDGAAAESTKRRADRFVATQPGSDDAAWLEAYLPAEDVAAVRAVLDAAADTLRGRDGEDRTTDQLRAAALAAPFWAALATGHLTTPDGPLPLATSGGQTPAVVVTVAGDGVADLERYGPVSAQTAREVAARTRSGRWPVVRVVHVFDAEAAQQAADWPIEPAYRPSAALKALVRRRDRRCRFPGCSATAARADLDHTRPWPDGSTHPDNLAVLCRRHHRVKQTSGFRLEQTGDGDLRWTMPTGHVHTTSPPA